MTGSLLHHRTRVPTFPSIRQRFIVVLLLCLLIWSPTPPAQAEPQYWTYTVRPGDNIWDLTRKYCVSVMYWKHIQQLNRIRLDRQIPPGTKLLFPLQILKYQPASAEVAKIRGKATLVRASDSSTQPLSVQSLLHAGDRLITEPGANVTLRFADGSELLVLEDSEVVMDTLSAWGATGMVDTRVRLQGGRVDTRVEPSKGPGSRYQIITPAAVAAVRGTRFRVSAEKQAPVARSEVTEGTVAVGDKSQRQDIPAGFGLVSERGKPQQKPRKLLPAPKLAASDTLQRQLPLRFSWSAPKGARGYRIQIAPNDQFDTLIADKLVSDNRTTLADLPDGHYAVRVRGIDSVGLEGLNAVGRFEVDARPLAPGAHNLTGGLRVVESRPTFTWSGVADVRGYHIELARDASFTQIIYRAKSDSGQFIPPETLQPGNYYWRVASVADDGDPGPFSAAHHFVYRPRLEAPAAVDVPQIERSTLAFAWQAVDQATRYRLQIAEDPDFKQLIVDREVAEPRAEVPRPDSRRYYYRVSAGDAHGEVSLYTEPRELEVPPHNYWGLLILLLPLLVAL